MSQSTAGSRTRHLLQSRGPESETSILDGRASDQEIFREWSEDVIEMPTYEMIAPGAKRNTFKFARGNE